MFGRRAEIQSLMQLIQSFVSNRRPVAFCVRLCTGHGATNPCGKCSKAYLREVGQPRLFGRFNLRLSSSSSRWKVRQGRDKYTAAAKVQGLKSRAAFKLLEVCDYILGRMGFNTI